MRTGRGEVWNKLLLSALAVMIALLIGSVEWVCGMDLTETVTAENGSGVMAVSEGEDETEGESSSEDGSEEDTLPGNIGLTEGDMFLDTDRSAGSDDTRVPDAVFETEIPQTETENPQTETKDDSIPGEGSENTESEISREENAPEDMITLDESEEEETEAEEGFLLQAAGTGEITGTTGRNGTVLSWSLSNNVLTVSGSGPMDDYSSSSNQTAGYTPEWRTYSSQIQKVVITEGVTSVGNQAFSGLSYLKEVTIAGSVKRIGNAAFSGDSGITAINLSKGIEKIETNAFFSARVEELILPQSLREIGSNALAGLFSLKNYQMNGSGVYSVSDGVLYRDGGRTLVSFPAARTGSFTVPGSVRKIAGNAFYYTGITGIVLPDTLEEIEGNAFSWSAVEEVVIPGSVRKIRINAFASVKGLRRVVIKEGVKEIENLAFHNNSRLTEVSLPQSLEKIGSGAFDRCAISTIRIPAGVTSIGRDALNGINNVILEDSRLVRLEDGSYIPGARLDVTAYEDYDGAYRILELTNQERAKIGAAPLTMDRSLLESAMLRGFETVLLFSHERPNGLDCFSANSLMNGENIAVYMSPEDAFEGWMNSPGHAGNILNRGFTGIGIGCVRYAGMYYCVQCFTFSKKPLAPAPRSDYVNGNRTRTVIYDPARYPNLKNALIKEDVSDDYGDDIYGNTNGSEAGVITIAKTPSSVKAKGAKKGKITVRWKKLKKTKKTKALWNQIQGIEVQYSTDASFQTNTNSRMVGKKKAKLQIKGLAKKTTYYVRVRYTDGYGGYSEWSKVKTVKTKK